jgi:ParB family chromosome partitioning protein
MTQRPILVPASKLAPSPSNVRTSSDPAADAQLEANIAERGILQNLVGLPVPRKKGHYRITAGGRRLACVHRLIEAGTFPSEYPVPVLVLTDANDAIEISLSENFFRLALNPADACRAFQDIIQTEGKSPADVARRFGLTERFVLGRLRLASLAEPIFQALAGGEITLDVASAYASTCDVERQAVIYEQLAGTYYGSNVGEIRRRLASYSYRANDPRALLVGRDAYLRAGGRVDSDLFTDVDSEAWLDTQLVDALVEERLAAAAAEVRERDGFAEVRVVAATHLPYAQTYDLQPLRGDLPPLTPDEETRQSEIEQTIEAIEAAAGDGDLSDAEEARLEALEEELGALVDRMPILTDEQRTAAIAFLVIGDDGKPRLHEELFAEPAVEILANAPSDQDEEAVENDRTVPVVEAEKGRISQRLADELATMKTELLALHVARDPVFAADLGVFLMAEAATLSTGSWAIPSDLRAHAPVPRIPGFASDTRAAREWTSLEESLDRSWAACETIGARYDAFCALPDPARAAWQGWSIARTLHAVPVGRAGADFLDQLGCKLDIDVAAWWRPTAQNYFDRITKPEILGLLGDLGGAELRARHAASRKHDLAFAAEQLCAGDAIIEAEIKDRALQWVPSEMRFPAGAELTAVETGPDLEESADPATLAPISDLAEAA